MRFLQCGPHRDDITITHPSPGEHDESSDLVDGIQALHEHPGIGTRESPAGRLSLVDLAGGNGCYSPEKR
jgi:hypothetical protein